MKLPVTLKPLVPLTVILLMAGCSSSDERIAMMAQQQAQINAEMVRLNREVAQGLTKITKENAKFRNESLIIQKQLHAQRAELIVKQDELAEERRQFAQHDPLVAKAVTHIGISLACLLPLGLCWYLLREPVDQRLEPVVNDTLLEDLTSKQPVLVAPVMTGGAKRLPFRADVDVGDDAPE